MSLLVNVVAIALAVAAVAYVVAPLFRSESSLDRSRTTGGLYAPFLTASPDADDEQATALVDGCCPHCGTTIDGDYTFCRRCARRLPRRRP